MNNAHNSPSKEREAMQLADFARGLLEIFDPDSQIVEAEPLQALPISSALRPSRISGVRMRPPIASQCQLAVIVPFGRQN